MNQARPSNPSPSLAQPLEESNAPLLPADPAMGHHSPEWTFLTNHAHVLIVLAINGQLVLREVARQVGITERAVQRIIADLEAGGYLRRQRIGRQNQYVILPGKALRHPIEAHRSVDELIALVARGRSLDGT